MLSAAGKIFNITHNYNPTSKEKRKKVRFDFGFAQHFMNMHLQVYDIPIPTASSYIICFSLNIDIKLISMVQFQPPCLFCTPAGYPEIIHNLIF